MNNKKLTALKIVQPLASFFITKMRADDLLKVSFSEELQYIDEQGRLKGNQRPKNENRLKSIAKYIDSVEMSFPNCIIISANYDKNTGEIVDDEKVRWSVKEIGNDLYEINIPTNQKIAAVIDGQHRLNAFEYVSKEDRKSMELVCAVFFDLSNAYQAFLFATINGNQKKVDKGLALEQFGFNVEDEESTSWTPEKFAVYYCRKLNFKPSALTGKIKLSPQYSEDLFKEFKGSDFYISTATIVDGILSLISSNPKRDRVEMGQKHIFKGRSRKMVKDFRDSSPLRDFYINNKDEIIFSIIKKYFEDVNTVLWERTDSNTYIKKTVGVQALFDLLKKILKEETNYDIIKYSKYLNAFSGVDFSDNFFQASGVGKSRIKRIMFVANNFYQISEIKEEEQSDIKRLLNII